MSTKHYILNTQLHPPFPENTQQAMFGMGCFWGAERKYWQQPGVYTTAVGYAAGHTEHPDYESVCSGSTGHAEVVLIIFDSENISYGQLLKLFWESHDPTQGMRQGNDKGSQYRSGIYTFDAAQQEQAEQSRDLYAAALNQESYSAITTEIIAAPDFHYAEDYHQQYLARNPQGYCGLGGTGVRMPKTSD